MSVSDFYANKYLDAALGTSHHASFPNTVYIALFSTPTTDAGGGTELTGGGYARVAVLNNNSNWPLAANRLKSNGQQITFPEATNTWAIATHAAIADAATGTVWIHHGPLRTPRQALVGNTLLIPSDTLLIGARKI